MRLLLLPAVWIIAAISLNAQLVIGPTLGLNMSTIHGQDRAATLYRPNAGINFTCFLGDRFSIGMDVLGSGEGVRVMPVIRQPGMNYPDIGLPSGTIQSLALRLPVKASWFLTERGQKWRPKVFAGLSPAFILGGKVFRQDYLEINKKFDLGILAGMGLNYRIHKAFWASLDLQYTHGLYQINKNQDFARENRNISVNIGIAYPLCLKM